MMKCSELGTRLAIVFTCFSQRQACIYLHVFSLVPRPLPDFIPMSPQLRDKIWEWPGDEASMYYHVLLYLMLQATASFQVCLKPVCTGHVVQVQVKVVRDIV